MSSNGECLVNGDLIVNTFNGRLISGPFDSSSDGDNSRTSDSFNHCHYDNSAMANKSTLYHHPHPVSHPNSQPHQQAKMGGTQTMSPSKLTAHSGGYGAGSQLKSPVSSSSGRGTAGTATAANDTSTTTSTGSGDLHVNFIDKGDTEVNKKREKFLTAKYGTHQMNLIRKRLAVELWMFESLQDLYETKNECPGDSEVEIDLDELLDLESQFERRKLLQELLSTAKKSHLEVNKFIDELLDRAETL